MFGKGERNMQTIERINQLAAERAGLFRAASNGQRGDPLVLVKISAIGQELERLWDQRRVERAGRTDGIDRLIDRQYEQMYGPGEERRPSQRAPVGLAA
jgi:hypothetical protein